jgi:hypothetical protein
METLNITLHRVRSSRYGLDGKITIDGIKFCDTVENRNVHLKAGFNPRPYVRGDNKHVRQLLPL